MQKKIISSVILLTVLALILWGASHFIKPKGADVASNPCSIDVNAIIMPDPEGKLKTDRDVTQAMFDHYFSYYVDRPQCLDTSLKSSKLVKIGNINHDVKDHFIADITFNLQPTSLSATKWVTPESATTSDGWINHKTGTMSIRVSSSTYYLVI